MRAAINPHTITDRVTTPILLDTRGVISAPVWTAAGWTVLALGYRP